MAFQPLNSNGQKTMANSSPVVIASDQSAVKVDGSAVTQPISGTVTANAGTNLNTSALALDTTVGTTNTEIGGLTETAPATDTASSGLNGRLQRIAQRLTSLITALGSPFQAGGSIGNTSFGATQATAANLNATVVGTGTLAVQNTAATPAGINVIGKVSIDQTTPGTTNRVDIADSLNNPVSAFPATFLRTTDEPHQVFYDPFDSTLDVTNRWTSTQGSSGVAASNTTGVMSMGTGTVANGYSKLTSQPSFTLPIPAWLGVSDAIALPDGAAPTANSYRYWGTGTTPGTPTVATPITDGYGFELNTDGKLRAVVYAGGTRTVIQDLSTSGNSTQPLDANYHRYIIYIRTDKAYWYIDGITSAQLVATSNFQSAQVQTLPRLFLAVGNSTPPGSNTQIQCTGATAWDTGKNAIQLADGSFPWRKASVSSTGALSTSIAAGSAVIGHVITDTGSTTAVTGNVTVVQPTGTALHAVLDTTSTTAVTQATAANLNATVVGAGSAGTANAGVVTVQGIASMTKLLVTPDSVALPANQSVNVSQINGVTPLMGNGVTGTGSQRVTIASDNTAFAVNATLSAETTKVIGTVNQGTSPWVTSNATTSVVGNGTAATAQRVTIASDSTGTTIATQATGTNLHTVLDSGTLTTLTTLTGTTTLTPGTGATNLGKAEDAAHTSSDVGVMTLGVRETTLVDLSAGNTDGDYEPFQVTKTGGLWVTGAPTSTSGWSVSTGSIGNTKTDVGTANTPGNVGGWYFYNANATVAYVQFFNAQASAVTLGTTPPVYSLGIPATSGANVAPGMVGITHATAISIAVTTTRAGSTNTGSTVDFNIWYKQ